MSLAAAIRATEILLALAFLQQGFEHLQAAREERRLFLPRIILSVFLLFGFQTRWVCLALMVHAMVILKRFQGPYNGGSDRMGLLLLACLVLVHFTPALRWREMVFGYLALQSALSYCIAGWVKAVNPEWRNGQALQDLFRFSAYPVSESLRAWAERPGLIWYMSWMVMLLELLFPLTLLTHATLIAGLLIAAAFHFANACLFGLNRFFWIWLASYPSLLWFQERIFGMG
jgi:Vitamin K-dependent gamma-carboxylase